jgi:hypothetical protein
LETDSKRGRQCTVTDITVGLVHLACTSIAYQ